MPGATRDKGASFRLVPLALAVFSAAGLYALFAWGTSDTSALERHAADLIRARRYSEARQTLERLKARRDERPIDALLWGRLAWEEHRPRDALDHLDGVPDEHPACAEARSLAARSALALHRARVAEEQALRALELDPSRLEARDVLIQLYGHQARFPELNDQLRALSRPMRLTYPDIVLWGLLGRGMVPRFAETRKALQNYLEADPEDSASRIALAQLALMSGDHEEARQLLSPMPPDDPRVLACRAELALAEDDPLAAEQILAGVPAGHESIDRLRGMLAMAHRDDVAAVEWFHHALQGHPTQERATLRGLTTALERRGREDDADKARQRAAAFDHLGALLDAASHASSDGEPDRWLPLGRACRDVGWIDQARAWFLLCVKNDPTDHEAQHELATLPPSP